MRRLSTLLLLLFCTATAFAQDLTGTWEGTEEGNYMKLVIVKVGDEYIGYTYDTDPRGGWCRANFRGGFVAGEKQLRGAGDGMIAQRGGHVQCSFELKFIPGSNGDRLVGTERTKGQGKPIFDFLDFDEGPVELRRVSFRTDTTGYMRRFLPPPPPAAATARRTPPPTPPKPVATKPVPKPVAKPVAAAPKPRPKTPAATPRRTTPVATVPKKDTLTIVRTPPVRVTPTAVAPKPAAKSSLLTLKQERRNDVVQEIRTAVQQITIRVFDNGVPDGDTVSILHNNEVLYDHKLVTVQSFSFTVDLSAAAPVHDITLIAHNLGSIPPNTASIVVEAGDERYRLTASTDLQRNAVIRIVYRP